MKILITNIVTLNTGDAAILYAMIEILRKTFGDDTHFIVYDKHGELPGRYYPNLEFRKLLYLTRESDTANRLHNRVRFKLGLWAIKHNIPVLPALFLTSIERRDLLEYKNADLIVSSGGTYLVENYSLDARIFDYRISLYLDKPLVFFTQSLGPFSNPSNRESMLPIFDNSVAILVRDKRSAQNLVDLGVKNPNVRLVADAAFALSDTEALQRARHPGESAGLGLRVAISVREWRHFKSVDAAHGMNQYREALRALTRHLVLTRGARVTYLSTCQGMPEYWTDDSKVAQTIVDGLEANVSSSVSVDSSFHDPAVLAEKLKNYDLVIATRMHMAILSLGVGTPVLPIAYEFKMHELFERLGQGSWVQDIETITGDTLITTVDRFLESLPEIRGSIFAAVEKEHESAIASGQMTREAFQRWRQLKSA